MRFLAIFNAIIWLGFLWFFLFHVNPGSHTGRSCSMLNVTTAEVVQNIIETFEVLHKDQAQTRITIPSEIVDPAKSVASKAGEHIATAVVSAKQAVSTPLADIWQNLRSKFFDDLTRWEDTVPVYFCLQTRGVWQLGYPNSTSKIVSSKDFDVLDTLQITELDSLFSMARQIVPGLPDGLVSEMAEVNFNVLDTMAAAAYWSLVVLLVGTFLMVLISVPSEWTKWLLCLPLMAVGLLKTVLLVTALACMGICLAVNFASSGILSVLDVGVARETGTTTWLSGTAVVWLLVWFLLDCICL
ncbi:hypothetical protein BDP55DRAFT_687962 [Colletotrichum godetiae]|uniref:Uncharacterized protein n=1 Tax=Colletotrichum godetiae TaxID=1209918 RepID=A0AAJ0EKR9_9PEZI|nr:uncharacterized protein BDP55DRAFT_687962 [Colletotrichum godetiae]KAK1656745.1 hypothetical protein BDP55DRAFT_687962 [Colletotrichum godetiae]